MESQNTDPFGRSPSMPFLGDEEELRWQYASAVEEIENSTPYRRMLASTAELQTPDMRVGARVALNTVGSETGNSPESDKTVKPDVLEDGYGVLSAERPTHGSRPPPPRFGSLPVSSSAPLLGLQFTQDDLQTTEPDNGNMFQSPLEPMSKLRGPVPGYNYGEISSSMSSLGSPSPAKHLLCSTQQRSASSLPCFPSRPGLDQLNNRIDADASRLASPSTPMLKRQILASQHSSSLSGKIQPSTPQHDMSYIWKTSTPHVGNYTEDPFVDRPSLFTSITPTLPSRYTATKPNIHIGSKPFSQPVPQPVASAQTPRAKPYESYNTNTTGTIPRYTNPTSTNPLPARCHILQTPENYNLLALRQPARTRWITQHKDLIMATLRANELAYALYTRLPTASTYETWQAALRDVAHAMDLERLLESRRALFMPVGMRPIRTSDVGAFTQVPSEILREENNSGQSTKKPSDQKGVLLGGELALMERICAETMNRRKGGYVVQGAAGPGAENLSTGEKKMVRKFFVEEVMKGTERREREKKSFGEKVVRLVGTNGEVVMVRVGHAD